MRNPYYDDFCFVKQNMPFLFSQDSLKKCKLSKTKKIKRSVWQNTHQDDFRDFLLL